MRAAVLLMMCLAVALANASAAPAGKANAPREIGVEFEQFEFFGDWSAGDPPQASGGRALVSGGQVALPAVTAIEVPVAGRYILWVRAMDFPDDRPGTRLFTMAIGGTASSELFGDSRKPGFSWERGGEFTLAAGRTLIEVKARTSFARADALLLTTDPEFVPSQSLGASGRHPRVTPPTIELPSETDPLAAEPVQTTGDEPAAELANEFVRISFVPARRGGRPTVSPRVAIRAAGGWSDLPADPDCEIYAVVDAGQDARFDYAGFYPQWKSSNRKTDTVTVEVGGVKARTARGGQGTIWGAGELLRMTPRTARVEDGRVRLEFHPHAAGRLEAEWELREGERAARVRLTFTPARAGQFALGYHLFFRRPPAQIEEILLPMMWHRRRLPEQPRMLLSPFTPTPVALAQTREYGQPWAWAIVAEPEMIPFAWPNPDQPHFGLAIRDHAGAVQPAIYGPVPGTAAARAAAGQPVRLALRVLVQPGDWYAGFRTAADEVCRWRDYRRNAGVSLTETALNMIDLLKDDARGGWWERGKGFYQIETKNGVTHAAPLTLLSLYRITGDEDLYRRRALPAMEYVLSRRSAHFSPLPHDTGRYDAGGMDGPVKLFGTVMFSGYAELTQRRTPAFAEIALPGAGVRPTAGYSHVQPFDDWLARYQFTGDVEALRRARELADSYIAQHVTRPPAHELGAQPFFFITFVPDWEGLLRLFEVTGERRYLDAAAFGARQLMTGLWTQPVIPAGEITIHPGGHFKGDTLHGWRGANAYRLGAPRRPDDTPEKRVPAWLVSNVGLGFEQPSTYRGAGQGRMIYQMGWAADFLRLARHTGEREFETAARNAVLGRWASYPGYYATGFTDLPLRPRYPYDGPDVTDFYYHHIAPHLAWTIDYLVAEAELRSGGAITFPSQRQNGYAYFDSRVYGHAPGRMGGEQGVWLWLRRGAVEIDNPQLNHLLGRRDGQVFIVVMNESTQAERATVRFSPQILQFDPARVTSVTLRAGGGPPEALPLRAGMAYITVPPRGWAVLRLDGAAVDVRTHRAATAVAAGRHPGFVTVASTQPGIEARGAALQVAPGGWDAYAWCTASPPQAERVTFHYTTNDGGWRQQVDDEYPFELSVPIADGRAAFRFFIVGRTPDGREFRTPEAVIGAPADAR